MDGARLCSILSRKHLNTLALYPNRESCVLTSGARNAWDIHNQPADNVGANMAEFALGSIATMATNNPLIQTGGNLPILGSRLQIDWAFAIALLVCIASVHSALFILAICADRWNRNNSQSETELLTNNDPNLSNEQTQSA